MKTRRTILGYYNPSERNKALKSAKSYRKMGYKVVVERNKRWGTIDVLKINKPKRKKSNPFSLI